MRIRRGLSLDCDKTRSARPKVSRTLGRSGPVRKVCCANSKSDRRGFHRRHSLAHQSRLTNFARTHSHSIHRPLVRCRTDGVSSLRPGCPE